MQIAILVFPKLTLLDAIGPYEVLRLVPGWEVRFVAPEPGPQPADSGALAIVAEHSLEDVTSPDVVLVPGGEGNRPLLGEERVIGWLRSVHEGTRWTTSVCTGSLVLGAAGLLRGRRATSHWFFLEQLGIEYDPKPPHDAGSPAKAPAAIVEAARAAFAAKDDSVSRSPPAR
jgi:putative intracellular protease/amidase